MDNWLNTGLGRDFLHALSQIGRGLTKPALPSRDALAFDLYKRQVTQAINEYGEVTVSACERIAENCYAQADAFLGAGKAGEKKT
jgi:hypothetical protein